MKTWIGRLLLLVVLTFGFLGTGVADVITFDDLSSSGDTIPDGYGGFTWGIYEPGYEWLHYGWRVWDDTDAPSPANVATNYCDGGDVYVSSASAFDFNGAYFAGYDGISGSEGYGAATAVTIVGYNSGIEVGTVMINLSNTYSWAQINLLGVDTVLFDPSGGSEYSSWLAMDNFTYNEPTGPVPEPATIFLLGSGLIGLAGLRKKFFV